MTTVREFLLPDLGEGLTEAELVQWRVGVGDTVELNQIIAEVETEKAVVELPSPFAGTVVELKAVPGTTMVVGSPLITIAMEGPADAPAEAPADLPADSAEGKVAVLVGYGPSEAPPSRRRRSRRHAADDPPPGAGASRAPLAKPPVRFLARQLDVDLADLQGSGPGGVVTREDVRAHATAPADAAGRPHRGRGADGEGGMRETRVPVRGVRKHTADAVVRSAFTAPHVTEFVTVDVTPTMEMVQRLGETAVFTGVRVTPLLLVAKALLLALGEHPSLNTSWDEATQEIVLKHYVNLGIAAATPRGLIVPNIKDAHLLSLRELAESLAALTATARDGRSTPAELSGGTITITNIGVFGVDSGTPILNPGEAAILCFGAVRRQPWEFRDEVALRSVCTLSLSFDHRLVDGEEGSRFLADIARTLADPTLLVALS
ncbi:MAG TPA: dihydrolipoamide acetyltransferase family protein [Acidimicrobiales bacterium]|nr:dihydrolipoamide acetyltransferase family protein [Acidimicrobiales bacterium]